MHHPFEYIPPEWRKKLFWLGLFASLALMIVLNLVGAPLTTAPAPYGIVSYELAGSVSQSQAILESWDQQAQMSAAFSLGLDYLFMAAYSTAIGLGCLWAADTLRRRGWPLSQLGVPLAWGQWLAAMFDGIENLALTRFLFGGVVSPWPELARWCALLKFALIFAGLVYAFLGWVVHLSTRLTPDGK
jgi:hypothetical protein